MFNYTEGVTLELLCAVENETFGLVGETVFNFDLTV